MENLLESVFAYVFSSAMRCIGLYFVNAMTTVSAAIFLYSPDTSLAAVAVLNMDDAGDTVAAVAMSILILTTSCVVKLIHWLFTRKIMARSQHGVKALTKF